MIKFFDTVLVILPQQLSGSKAVGPGRAEVPQLNRKRYATGQGKFEKQNKFKIIMLECSKHQIQVACDITRCTFSFGHLNFEN
jgi:hypothetical protein